MLRLFCDMLHTKEKLIIHICSSVCVYLFLLFLYFFICVSLNFYHSSLCPSLCIVFVSLCGSLSNSLFVRLSVCLSVSLLLCICVCMNVSLFPLSISVSCRYHFVTLSLSFGFYCSHSLSLTLCVFVLTWHSLSQKMTAPKLHSAHFWDNYFQTFLVESGLWRIKS